MAFGSPSGLVWLGPIYIFNLQLMLFRPTLGSWSSAIVVSSLFLSQARLDSVWAFCSFFNSWLLVFPSYLLRKATHLHWNLSESLLVPSRHPALSLYLFLHFCICWFKGSLCCYNISWKKAGTLSALFSTVCSGPSTSFVLVHACAIILINFLLNQNCFWFLILRFHPRLPPDILQETLKS